MCDISFFLFPIHLNLKNISLFEMYCRKKVWKKELNCTFLTSSIFERFDDFQKHGQFDVSLFLFPCLSFILHICYIKSI